MAVTYLGDGWTAKPPTGGGALARMAELAGHSFLCAQVPTPSSSRMRRYRMRAKDSTGATIEWAADDVSTAESESGSAHKPLSNITIAGYL